MNLPNRLTLARFFMIPFFVVFMNVDHMGLNLTWQLAGHVIALGLFIAATVTDYYDGAIARRLNLVTNFGRLMDPLADKLLISAGFIVLIEQRIAPAWMVIIILCREFLVTGLRLLGTSQGRVIQADRGGKNKTISQLVAVITALSFLVIRDILTLGGWWQTLRARDLRPDFWMEAVLYLLLLIATGLTLTSGWNYFYKNRDLIREH